MPVQVQIHATWCPVTLKQGACRCTPTPMLLTRLGSSEEAAAIHGGNAARMQIIGIVPLPPDFTKHIPPERSQARRHRGTISD